jgi:hypothetical protein
MLNSCVSSNTIISLYPLRRDFLRGAEKRATGAYGEYVRMVSFDGNKGENSFAKGILNGYH